MARNPFEQLLDDFLSMVWKVICGLVKILFNLICMGVGALWRKVTGKPAEASVTVDGVTISACEAEAMEDAVLSAFEEVARAHSASDWKTVCAAADRAIPRTQKLIRLMEENHAPNVAVIRYTEAQLHYMRWDARAYLLPVITAPEPGESKESAIRRCHERDESLLVDLQNATAAFDEAIKGDLTIRKGGVPEARSFGCTLWAAVGRNVRMRDPVKGYAAQKRSISLNDRKEGMSGLEIVGSTAHDADQWSDFEELAERLIAEHPSATILLAGAAEAYWITAIKIRDSDESPKRIERKARQLAAAARHIRAAIHVEPKNADFVHLQGRIYAALNDVNSLEATIEQLAPLDRENPLPEDEAENRFFKDSRMAHLLFLLENTREYLANRP